MATGDIVLNLRVHQLLVGSVDSNCQPATYRVPATLRQLQFVQATCSVTLVEQEVPGGMKILVDCASAYESGKLQEALRSEGVTPEEITHLVLTHWHSDHCGNIGLFPNAQLITPEGVQAANALETINANLPEGINVQLYGGHSTGDIVVRVQQMKQCGQKCIPWNVVIAGDIFECEGDWEGDDPCWRQSSMAPDRQIISRFLCWKGADEIIPGHGPSFHVTTAFPHKSPMFDRILLENPQEEIIGTADNATDSSNGSSASVKQLICFKTNDQHRYTVYLIRGCLSPAEEIVLVNTGGPGQVPQLIAALSENGVSSDQITHVVVTNVGFQYCHNLHLFQNAKVFMGTDISLPGNYYASFDNFCLPINRGIIVWRDLDPVRESGSVSVLVKTQMARKRFTLIGSKLDRCILALMDLTDEDVELVKVVQKVEVVVPTDQ